jgi:hypothetical protein
MVFKMEFIDPTGGTEISQKHANRVDSLNGKTIGFLSNDEWQAFRMLPMIKEALEKNFSDIKVLPTDAFPLGNHNIAAEETTQLVIDAGVDVVIIGNAA